jgi:hypothetical protein
MSATESVKRSIQEVEREFTLQDAYLPKHTETPLSSGYRPELDFSADWKALKSTTSRFEWSFKADC